MSRDRSPVWVAMVDLVLATLAVVIVAVAPQAKKLEGPKQDALLLVTLDWAVNEDADLDLWLMGPSKRPVFYSSREAGCATLDRDARGFLDSVVALADGSTVRVTSYKETIAIRCVEPGRYDVAVNDYHFRGFLDADGIYHDAAKAGPSHHPIVAHVEVTALNPKVAVQWAGDVTLARVGATINAVSFDVSREGALTLADPPLEPVTETFTKTRTGAP